MLQADTPTLWTNPTTIATTTTIIRPDENFTSHTNEQDTGYLASGRSLEKLAINLFCISVLDSGFLGEVVKPSIYRISILNC